jgi:hypothetical protein
MARESSSTRHIGGLVWYFWPHTTTSKVAASALADQLRSKGYKVRVLRVYSSWNKRWQYELFTRPKHGIVNGKGLPVD